MHDVTRRSVARGAAWSLPALSVAAAAPGLAASTTPPADCHLTDAQLNAGVCAANSIQVVGAQSFSTTGGGAINATVSNNFGLKSTCNYRGSVSVYFHDPSSTLGGQVAKPRLVLADGRSYTGRATLGSIGSGGARVGFDMSVAIQWQTSTGTSTPRSAWTGARVSLPFDWYYTAPDGSLHHCSYALTYTMGTPFSAGVAAMVSPATL